MQPLLASSDVILKSHMEMPRMKLLSVFQRSRFCVALADVGSKAVIGVLFFLFLTKEMMSLEVPQANQQTSYVCRVELPNQKPPFPIKFIGCGK